MQSVEDFRYKLYVLHLQTFVMERQDKNNTCMSPAVWECGLEYVVEI